MDAGTSERGVPAWRALKLRANTIIHRTLLANLPQTCLRSLHRQAVKSGDHEAAETLSRFMVDAPRRQPSWHNVKATRITKKEYRRIFTKAAWVHHVWDNGNRAAKKYMDIARTHIGDPRFCVRVIHEVQDLDLRRRWMIANCNGGKLPRVIPEVKRLFEQEFQQTYPHGVSDIASDDT